MITPMDAAALKTASTLNWSAIDVAIFGTLFERGLDPKSAASSAPTTPTRATIMRIVTPVVERPLRARSGRTHVRHRPDHRQSKKHNDAASLKAKAALIRFLDRFAAYRVLDPAVRQRQLLPRVEDAQGHRAQRACRRAGAGP